MFKIQTDKYLNQEKRYKSIVFGDNTFKWYYCEHINFSIPQQGWKIHVSANISNASQILNTVLPYIFKHRLSFKHALSGSDLLFLNYGKGGVTQVGKFITIYCTNNDHFKETIKGLSGLFTKIFEVPFIVTDKRFNNKLPLFYRYGALKPREVQNQMGIFESVITDNYGNTIIDKRENTFNIPDGIIDPFKNEGIVNFEYINKLLLNNYVTFEKISDTYKTETYLGIDLSGNRCCVIKIAKPDIEIEKNIYSNNLLSNEIKILKALNHKYFPKIYEAFEENRRCIMITSLIDGIDLFNFISLNSIQGDSLTQSQIKKIFLSILDNVKELELKDIIHNDLKPNNIIIDKDLNTFLIDFETSKFKNDLEKIQTNIKSRGYHGQNSKNDNPDYYALGMILYFMYTGYNISDAPREYNILERPLNYITGKSMPEIENFISKLCGDYYSSIDVIIKDFNAVTAFKASHFVIKQKDILPISKSYVTISTNVVKWIYNNCIEYDGFTYWKSTHVFNSGNGRTDINIGSSGILIFLSYYNLAAKELSGENHKKLENAIKFITTNKYDNQISGLFVGESGKVLAAALSLISIGKFDIELVNENLEYIKNNIPVNDDLFNGKSGVGLLFIIVYILSKDKKHLETAIYISNKIINSTEIVEDEDSIFWKDCQTKSRFLGFAHGISGIGYFLIILYKFTFDKNLLAIIKKIASTLIHSSVIRSGHSKLINWPNEPGENISNNHWCNGTSGIAHFFLELYKVTKDEYYSTFLNNCANTVIRASSFMNPTLCHGLAGNINFLINYYQLTKSKKIKAEIFRLSEVLKMSGVISGDYFLFPSESPDILSPDFWVGFSGTAYVFQRLTDIDNNFDFLSTEYYQNLSLRFEKLQTDY